LRPIQERRPTGDFPVFSRGRGRITDGNSGAIITDAFPKKELGMGLGTAVMAVNLGNIAGYTLGGVLVTYFGWQSIFLVNIPSEFSGQSGAIPT